MARYKHSKYNSINIKGIIAPNTIVDYISYILSLVLLWTAYKAEWKDLHCGSVHDSNDKCKDFGGGMAYVGSEPLNNDPNELLLSKIERASYTEELTVKWRRCYILSFFITLFLWVTIMYPIVGRLPRFYEYFLMLFIVMMILYYSFSFYSFHHYEAPAQYIRKSVDILRDNLDLKKTPISSLFFNK